MLKNRWLKTALSCAFVSATFSSLIGCSRYAALPPQATSTDAERSRIRDSIENPTFQKLYSFGAGWDGANPSGTLIVDGGILYGTTQTGGAGYAGPGYGSGTVYTIATSGKERVIHRFKFGNVAGPTQAGLTRIGDTLYGTTQWGGTGGSGCPLGCGTVFAMNTSGKVRLLYSFKGPPDGMNPTARLVAVSGRLYGTTLAGGPQSDGTVFEISTSGVYRSLYQFTYGSGGNIPEGDLIYAGGKLYGVTYAGGSGDCQDVGNIGCGTVYSITPAGIKRVIYRFKGGTDGDSPSSGLTWWNGVLYGTTYFGGNQATCSGGCGTVFSLDPTSNRERVLYRFNGGSDGLLPDAPLLVYRGALYGTTVLGGNGPCFPYSSCGTAFRVSGSGVESVLHSFQGADGYEPYGRLTAMNGVLYGTTIRGGTKCRPELGCGTVFALTP